MLPPAVRKLARELGIDIRRVVGRKRLPIHRAYDGEEQCGDRQNIPRVEVVEHRVTRIRSARRCQSKYRTSLEGCDRRFPR